MNYLVNSKLFCLHYFLKLKPLTLKEICVVPFELKLCIKIEDRKPETVNVSLSVLSTFHLDAGWENFRLRLWQTERFSKYPFPLQFQG